MNLIICCTPLQVLIAEKIIDLYPEHKFYGVLFCPVRNAKYEYYYNRLKKKCIKANLIEVKDIFRNKYYLLIKMIFLWVYSFKFPKVDRVFLANIDIFYIHTFIGRFNNSEIITFDDGAINLNFKQNFFTRKKTEEIFGSKLLCLLKLLNSTTLDDILRRKVKHYSIYKLPNIMGETTYIELFDCKNNIYTASQSVSILVGQPIFQDKDNNKYADIALMKRIIEDYKIDYYLPHPRESYFIDGVNYINTPLIFEEYIMKSIEENPNKRYVIYTLFSSVALNLISIPQVQIVSLKPKNYSGIGDEVYNLFSHCGIRIESIEINE